MRRKGLIQQYNALYSDLELVDPSDKWFCFYCGQEAGTKDHQPPITKIDTLITKGKPFEAVLIPACLECNSILSDLTTLTVCERTELVKNKLRNKYKKQLRSYALWTEEDIKELGPGLKPMVIASIKLAEETIERINYPGHSLRPTEKYWKYGNECPECGAIYYSEECKECK
jgi:hypothetical protein